MSIEEIMNAEKGARFNGRKKEKVYLAASQRIKSICNDEDDSIPLRDIIARYSSSVAITSSPSVLPTREPEDSLIIGDEHLDTIPERIGRINKSLCENLVLKSSESRVMTSHFRMRTFRIGNFKIYSNPLFDDEEIISPKIDPHYFNAESNLIESLLHRDILIDSSPKIDYLLRISPVKSLLFDPFPSGLEKTPLI
ncbi:hypothetical protein Tco_0016305 [Tanacetum coccineum]